jgi:pyruvate/2-oxoglutarate/acetoin dehydrogenase E1 component
MTYKEELTNTMFQISNIGNVRFIGYNVVYGHQFNGTLINVPKNKLIEMPVAENLIMGMAMGMALEGYRMVVCVERMDFLWACADAIVNHLDKAHVLGWPSLPVIIRTCVGSCSPLDPGCQHRGSYIDIFDRLLTMPVLDITRCEDIFDTYNNAMKIDGPVMIVEHRSLYPTLATVSSKASSS